jgi:uncharacterized membrane protein YobD (UPF0266 family)
MSTNVRDLGRLVAIHPIAPAYLQRAAFMAVLSFIFFLAMMVGFYIRQSAGYFLLATAFLIVYLIMMFSLFWQRKSIVKIYENGIEFKKFFAEWHEIEAVDFKPDRRGISRLELKRSDGLTATLPDTVVDAEGMKGNIRRRISNAA